MSFARKLVPLADRVLVRKIMPQQKTAGGLYLPDSVQKKEAEGEVVAVGPGTVLRDGSKMTMVLKAGDRVLLPEYGGSAVEIGNEELVLFRQDEILGKFE